MSLSPPQALDDSRSATLHEEKNSSPPSRDEMKSANPSMNEKEIDAGLPAPLPEAARASDVDDHKEEVHTEAERVAMGHDLKEIKTSESGIEYPSGLRLNLISLALSLSVFLMALVGSLGLVGYTPATRKTNADRITQSLQPPSPKSPTNSTALRMWDGMVVVRSSNVPP